MGNKNSQTTTESNPSTPQNRDQQPLNKVPEVPKI